MSDERIGEQFVYDTFWKKCNFCKKELPYTKMYWVCNVSTCNRKRTGLSFCSVSCWDAHLPDMNHREAWAEERRAPTRDAWKQMLLEDLQPKTRVHKEKTEVEAPKVSSSPKVIRRSKASS